MAHTEKKEFRYDSVVFDVGGTLLGFHERLPFQEFLASAGLPATEQDARNFHRRLVSVIVGQRDAAQGLGANESELYDWWRINFEKTWPDRPDLAQEMSRWLTAGRFDRLYADVVPTLDALQELGMPMGILSNFGTHLREVLHRSDLLRYFDFVVVSAEVQLAKPDPRIFDLVIQKAGYPAGRLLYVGDHVGDDIEGARGAGLDAVLIDRGDHSAAALCPRVRSLRDLVLYVRYPTKPAKAIIFDMDGVVLDSMPMHLETWRRALAPLGAEMTADDLYPLEGVPTERTAKLLTKKLLGQSCSDLDAQRLANTKRDLFRQRFQPALVPGIGPLLYDLRGRGYRLGLVTGSARTVVEESLIPTGVGALFDGIVTGDEVVEGKPDPEPYRTAAERLKVAPSDCLAVENAPLGVRSAKGAGMCCIGLETTLDAEDLTAAGADEVFRGASELREWLLSPT